VKFSDLLGEPEPEDRRAAEPVERPGEAEPDPITVFAPVPEVSPNRPPPAAPFEPDVDATIPAAPPVPVAPAPVAPVEPVAPIEPRAPIGDATIPAMPPVPPPVNPPLDPFLDAPPPDPTFAVGSPTGRSDLASLNVHQPAPVPEPPRISMQDQLAGLDEVVDDLLPPRRGRK
jgi:hypothetical protein